MLQRDDDCEATVMKRLEVYFQQTSPLKAYYKLSGLLRQVDGFASMDLIQQQIETILEGRTVDNP